MIIGNSTFDTKRRAYVMGILNVTPDSFSDGGKFNNLDDALFHAERMIKDGAAIIDVGGESTRPGYVMIPDDEEIERTAPVIEALKKRFDAVISLDTYKSRVAAAGIAAGADMINDIWGLKCDSDMADVISRAGVSCCLMHNRLLPGEAGRDSEHGRDDENEHGRGAGREAGSMSLSCSGGCCSSKIEEDVLFDLRESVFKAKRAGIADERIMIDPGIGFGKTYEMNLRMLGHLSALSELGFPVLLGTSRKSVIGMTLKNAVDERCAGTVATTVYGFLCGCRFFRVHDVKENVDALRMITAIKESD